MRSIRAIVTGRVQGVGFRVWTERTANELSLTGWVRNCEDDTVEVIAQGEEDRMLEFIQKLHRGPRFAEVERVAIEDSVRDEGLRGFRILRS